MKLAVQYGHFGVLVNNAGGLYGLLAGGGSFCHFLQCIMLVLGLLVLQYPSLVRYRALFVGDFLLAVLVGVVSYDAPSDSSLSKRVAMELASHSASPALEHTIFTLFVLLAFAVKTLPLYFLYSFK